MTFSNSEDDWSNQIINKIEELSIPAQYYLFRNFLDNTLHLSNNLSNKTRWILMYFLEIEVKTLKQLEMDIYYEYLLNDIELEKKQAKL
ncbi:MULTISPECIES: hypothetical protein [Peribacillus]|uniref:hypothetical protein n=1 Tax=Peribacillus TaxID=2675229 RepID=UPI001F4ED2BF|nr:MULTISPECIES: hypothetical protein [unclassified Peribacillus]MCK1982036.1 hypothetical protein [Peribacillus sp. Aquil_B1]MCK2007612.1 hypothetical protein [Peribacillus sp. Aquil_B8]